MDPACARSTRAIAVLALERFARRAIRIQQVAESFNTVFRVTTADGALLLRVGPAQRIHDPHEAEGEAAWTDDLAARGLPVPRLLRTPDGHASVVVGPGAGHECALLTWRPGQPLVRPLKAGDLDDLAVLSARLHDASPPRAVRPLGALDGGDLLHLHVPDLLPTAPARHREVLAEARSRALDALGRLAAGSDEPPRLIHSDLTPTNSIRSRGTLAAIDFQDLTWGRVEQDLASTLYGVTRGVDLDAAAAAFRRAYERVRPWPDLRGTLLADLVIARRLEMIDLALVLRRPGLDEYLADRVEALRLALRSPAAPG